MKKYIILSTIVFLLLSCGKKTDINGHVTNADGKLLSLTNNAMPFKLYDTARLKTDGKFSFKNDITPDEPVFMVLSADSKHLATLLAEQGEKIKLDIDYNNPGQYSVTGSAGSLLVKELNDKVLESSKTFDSLTLIMNKAEGTPEYENIRADVTKKMTASFTKYKHFLIRFIITNNKSYASYMAMYQTLPNGFKMFGTDTDVLYYKVLADSLETKYPKSQYVKKLREDYKALSNSIAMKEKLKNAQEVTGLPDIELPDAGGKMVKLSDLRGKVVLLDFWTSTDKGLLMNNMELKEVYNKYKSKGFEVYQISLDVDREKWLSTINTQGLSWISVCDFQGIDTRSLATYNVNRLPANYLISKSGEIVAKDIFGKDLEQAITKALQAK